MHPMRIGDVVFGAACAFMYGVFAADEHWPAIGILASCAAIAIAWIFFTSRSISFLIAAAVIAAGFLGYGYAHMYTVWQYSHTHLPNGKNAQFLGTVVDEPRATGKFLMMPVRLSKPYRGMLTVFASANSSAQYGDLLWIEGTVSPAATGSDELPAVFYPRIRTIAQGQGSWWKERLIAVRAAIGKGFARALPTDEAALLAAILLGSTGAVAGTLKTQMDVSGTTYVIGMYGYKMIIIMAAVRSVIEGRISRRWMFGIVAAAVISFAIISGAGVSVTRAAFMGLTALAAQAFGRTFSPRNAVAFAALVMTIGNPLALIDAGFQLSFLSYLGIFYLRAPVNNLFHWSDPGFFHWKEHAMLSLTTNLAIVPIAMNAFADGSLTSFVSNVLIMIPWAPVLFGGIIVACVWAISPLLAYPAVAMLKALLFYELSIIRAFAAFVIPLPAFFGSGAAMVVYYGSLIVFAHYYAAPPKKDH